MCYLYSFSLSHSQCLFLLDVKVKYINKFLAKLLKWMEIGLYDFSSYPLAMKTYLDVEGLNVFQPFKSESTYTIPLSCT